MSQATTRLSQRIQRLREVFHERVRIFQPHADSHASRQKARGEQGRVVKLPVRRTRRVRGRRMRTTQ